MPGKELVGQSLKNMFALVILPRPKVSVPVTLVGLCSVDWLMVNGSKWVSLRGRPVDAIFQAMQPCSLESRRTLSGYKTKSTTTNNLKYKIT